MSKVAVVGFGRIGRSAVKAGTEREALHAVGIVDIASADAMAPLFEFDTNYGRWRDPVSAEADGLVIGDATIGWIDARQSAPPTGRPSASTWSCWTAPAGRPSARARRRIWTPAPAGCWSARPSKTLQDCDAVLLPGINLD